MKKTWIAIITVLFVMPALAEHHPGHTSDGVENVEKEKKIDQLVSELGLSPEQTTKIQASREKYKNQINEKETAFATAREKFRVTVENPNASRPEIESAYKQKEDAQHSLQDTIFQSRMEFREILTPEQRSKTIAKHEDKKERRKDRKEKFKEWKENRKDKKESKSGTDASSKP